MQETSVKQFIASHQTGFSQIRPLINNRVYLLSKDAAMVDALITQLGPENFQLTIFSDLNKLQTRCQQVPPAAILLDRDDPDTGGPDLDAIRQLRQQPTPCPPILCISSATDIKHRLDAAHAGSTRYFHKPLNLGKLGLTLRSFGVAQQHEPYRVLLIDDDEDLLTLFATQLRRSDMQVHTLTDAQQCLQTLADFAPDLLLLDVHMPGISGADLACVIRQDDSFAQLPIIYLSMDDDPQQQQRLIDLGGDEFLSKQTDGARLVARVQEQIKRAREARRINQGLSEALWSSELRRFALDNHAIVSASDVYGNISYVNDTFCQISGYRREELLGQNHRMLKSGQHSNAFYTDMWVTISQGNTWQGTLCNRRKDGTEYWVESTIVPFLDSHGLPYQYVSVRTDITALRASEDRLHRSQVFANIGTWDWNIQSGELFWSERVAPLFGYHDTVSETSYDNFIAAIHPEDRQAVINAISRCVERGDDYDIEHRVVWPDSSVHWLMERGDVVRDKQGAPLHMLGVVQDITLRKQSELEILKHRAAMDSSLEGMAIIDAAGQYRYVNPAMAAIYGYSGPDDLLNHYWTEHFDADVLMYFEEEVMPKLITRRQWSGEVLGKRTDGTAFPQTLSLSTLQDGDLVCIVHDITENKQTESELIKAKETAEQASLAKSQFLSSMSHELRTPMNAIIGFAQLLELEPLSKVQKDDVGEILKASSHLLQLINEVLNLSHVESGHLELSIEDTSLHETLTECLQLITPLAKQRGIRVNVKQNGKEVHLEHGQTIEGTLRADRTRLKQALINLLSNAVKYNCEQGRISVACQSANNEQLRISITDTGPGIAKDQQSQLFQPFSRLGAENTETEGTGIGLVYTKKIIELMDGRVGMRSSVGEGSTFWLELPCHSRRSFPDTFDESPQNDADTPTVNSQQNRYTVLYMEDNPANLRLMEQMLKRRADISLLTAHDPLQGLELAEQYRPELILLDINLPGINGYDVLLLLKKNEETQHIPVIAVSANAMQADVQRGLNAGFTHYITKPIGLSELFGAIDDALNKRTT